MNSAKDKTDRSAEAHSSQSAVDARRWLDCLPPHGQVIRLVDWLRLADVSREQLAHDAGISRSSLWRILRGKVRPLTPTCNAILDAARQLIGRVEIRRGVAILPLPAERLATAFDPLSVFDRPAANIWLAEWKHSTGPVAPAFLRLSASRPWSTESVRSIHTNRKEIAMLPAECYRFFHLTRDPWGPPEQDGTGLYESKSFRESKQLLVAAAESQGFACVAGPIGSGKTLLLASTLAELSRRSRFDRSISYLRCLDREHATAAHVLTALVEDLGAAERPARNKESLTRQVIRICLDLQERTPQRCPLLVIDEAQSLSREAMRALKRGREATALGFKPGLGVLLAGQTQSDPDVMELLNRSDLAEVRARAFVINLEGMDRRELSDYVSGKLRRAGLNGDGRDAIIEPAGLDLLHERFGKHSMPQNVDAVLTRAMVAGWQNRVLPMTAELIERAM